MTSDLRSVKLAPLKIASAYQDLGQNLGQDLGHDPGQDLGLDPGHDLDLAEPTLQRRHQRRVTIVRPSYFKTGPPSLAAATIVFFTRFSRTDLRISLSGAKFDAEADFDVRFSVARQNPRQIDKKRILFVRKFRRKIFWCVEK